MTAYETVACETNLHISAHVVCMLKSHDDGYFLQGWPLHEQCAQPSVALPHAGCFHTTAVIHMKLTSITRLQTKLDANFVHQHIRRA